MLSRKCVTVMHAHLHAEFRQHVCVPQGLNLVRCVWFAADILEGKTVEKMSIFSFLEKSRKFGLVGVIVIHCQFKACCIVSTVYLIPNHP